MQIVVNGELKLNTFERSFFIDKCQSTGLVWLWQILKDDISVRTDGGKNFKQKNLSFKFDVSNLKDKYANWQNCE